MVSVMNLKWMVVLDSLHATTLPLQPTMTARALLLRLAMTAMATALVDSDSDQICDQDEVTGCQDSTACNYDATATDAGYCDYADGGYDCDGNCLNDSDQDGICDEFEVEGCTDSAA